MIVQRREARKLGLKSGPVLVQAVEAQQEDGGQASWLQVHMKRHFRLKVMKIVAAIKKCVLPSTGKPEFEFPRLAGSYLTAVSSAPPPHPRASGPARCRDVDGEKPQEELGTPALAFVRTLCAVLASDTAMAEEVDLLRGNLLEILHVSRWSQEAQFKVRDAQRQHLGGRALVMDRHEREKLGLSSCRTLAEHTCSGT